ncbi:hypothetical protein M728_002972 [Ensifer sp. WSM1721]
MQQFKGYSDLCASGKTRGAVGMSDKRSFPGKGLNAWSGTIPL